MEEAVTVIMSGWSQEGYEIVVPTGMVGLAL